MSGTEYRCVDVELRADEDRRGPGRLVGTLLQYGEVSGERRERFEPGALHWPAGGVLLREQHNRQAPILRVEPEVRGAAVVLDVPLPDTQRGRDAATGIRNGTYGGLSVEFHSERESWAPDGTRVISRAELRGAGLVDDPSYRGSRVEVRARGPRGRRLWL